VAPADELSLVALLNFVLRARRRILLVAGAFFLVGAVYSVVRHRSWTSEASFQPQSGSAAGNLGQLAGIAAQFGLQLPQGEESQSPDFYVSLLASREILVAAGMSTYGEATEGHTLADYYEIDGATQGLREEKVFKRLSHEVQAHPDIKTGVITLSVQASSAPLAHALAARLLELLNEFNLRTRQSQAGAERAFAERRLAEVRDSLRAAEDRLQGFLQRNRDFRNSPELTFQQDRLGRDVTLQSQLYQTLATSYEQAKLGEVRDIPVLTIVGRPTLPPRADPRGLLKRSVLGAFLGTLLALALAFIAEMRATRATAPGAEFDELRTLLGAARAELGRIAIRGRRD
jgi:uncharacterized protein involved in exopolysaccharide biosynthesis